MKRLVGGLLWTLVAMWTGSYVALFAGLPSAAFIPIALAIGLFVAVDPLARIWSHPAQEPAAVQQPGHGPTELVRSI